MSLCLYTQNQVGGQAMVGGWSVVGGCLVGGGWVSCNMLESAPVPFCFRYYWDLVGFGPRGFGTKGLGTGLDNNKHN